MATLASVLRVMVDAQTRTAEQKITKFSAEMDKARAQASKAIEAKLGADFDQKAFDTYFARLQQAKKTASDRKSFRAALGADYSPAAFRAYQKEINNVKTQHVQLKTSFSSVNSATDKFNRGMMALRNSVMVLKWPVMIAGAGVAAQAIGAAAAAAIALGTSLAPLVGLLPAVASGYLALGSALIVGKLAFANVTQALGGNKKALEKLTPAQKAFVDQLNSMKGKLNELRNTAAQNLFPGLTQGLRNAMPLFGPFKQIIASTGKEMGNLAAMAGKSISGWGKDLKTIGGTNVVVLHNMGGALVTLLGAFKDILVVASPLTKWLSQMALDGARYVSSAVAAGRESGKLAAFFDRAKSAAMTWGQILGNLGASLFNVFKAAAPLGGDLATSINLMTTRLRAWTSSAQGQNKMLTYFQNMRGPISALVGLAGDLTKALFNISNMPGLEKTVTSLRGAVTPLQNLITGALSQIGPLLGPIIVNVAKLASSFMGASGPMTLALKLINAVLSAINSVLNAAPPLKAALVTLVGFASVGKLFGMLISPLRSTAGALLGIGRVVPGVNAQIAGLEGRWAALRAQMSVPIVPKVMPVGGAGGKPFAGQQLSMLPSVAQVETQAAAGASKWSTRFASVASAGMKMAGIGIGGMMLTQIASSIAGPGSTGKWITAIGSGATIGAALGSVFGPAGTAGGAAAGALGGALMKFMQGPDPAEEGRQWAKNFNSTMTPNVSQGVKTALQQAAAASSKSINTQAQNAPHAPGPTEAALYGPNGPAMQGLRAQYEKDWTATFQRVWQSSWNWGGQTGRAYGQQLVNTAHPSELIMTQGITTALSKVPAKVMAQGPAMVAAWQGSAAQQMIAYATTLEQNGKLPKGSVARMITSIQSQWPPLTKYLSQQGLNNAQAVARNMNFNQAQANLKNAVANFKRTYGDTAISNKLTNANILKNTATAMNHLQWEMHHGTAEGRAAATREYNLLRQQTKTYLSGMVSDTQNKFQGIAMTMGTKSGQARDKATGAFDQLQRNIAAAMNAGLVSVGDGTKMLAKAAEELLKTFGVNAKLPLPGGGYQLYSQNPHYGGTYYGGAGRAKGGVVAGRGLMQVGQAGERGRDTVPMSVGNQRIMVGAGEQVAVFNRHQQAVANEALAPMGGLSGLFSTVSKPHYMASGGWANVTASAESLGGLGYMSNPIVGDGWSELGIPPNAANVGTSLGRLPYQTHMRIRSGNQMVVAAKEDIGTGSDNGGDYPAIGLYPNTVAQLGLPAQSMYHVSIQRADGAALTVGAGAAARDIKYPQWKIPGSDVLSQAANAVFANGGNKAVKDYIDKQLPPPVTVSGGGGGGPVSGPAGTSGFQGHSVATWIIPILEWAQQHGWTGSVTSGYRPAAGSEHAGTQYPHGAIDVGDNQAIAAGQQLYGVLSGYTGPRPLLWGGIYITGYDGVGSSGYPAPGGHDFGHFSGTGHARGGFVRAMATGGTMAQDGWALVGEKGPELAQLPAGTTVHPAAQTAQMLAAQGMRTPLDPGQFPGMTPTGPTSAGTPTWPIRSLTPDYSMALQTPPPGPDVLNYESWVAIARNSLIKPTDPTAGGEALRKLGLKHILDEEGLVRGILGEPGSAPVITPGLSTGTTGGGKIAGLMEQAQLVIDNWNWNAGLDSSGNYRNAWTDLGVNDVLSYRKDAKGNYVWANQDAISSWMKSKQAADQAGTAFDTPQPDGIPIVDVDWAAVDSQRAKFDQMLKWDWQVSGWLKEAHARLLVGRPPPPLVNWPKTMNQMGTRITTAIQERQDALKQLEQRIKTNVKVRQWLTKVADAIKDHRKKNDHLLGEKNVKRKQLAGQLFHPPSSFERDIPGNFMHGKPEKDRKAGWNQHRIADWNLQISRQVKDLDREIGDLSRPMARWMANEKSVREMVKPINAASILLGGGRDWPGADATPTGRYGAVNAQLEKLTTGTGAVNSSGALEDAYQWAGTLVGPYGHSGSMYDSEKQIKIDQRAKGLWDNPAIYKAAIDFGKAFSDTGAGGGSGGDTGGSTATDDTAALLQKRLDLMTTQLTQARQAYAVSQAQYPILSQYVGASTIPITGAFALGGNVTRKGLALVGEHGPELASLPLGSHVWNASQTQSAMNYPPASMPIGSSAAPVTVEVTLQVMPGAGVDEKKLRVIASDEANVVIRGQARRGSRGLPGGGGG